jgi:hypothetical protein
MSIFKKSESINSVIVGDIPDNQHTLSFDRGCEGSSRFNGDLLEKQKTANKDCETVARRETKAVNVLRALLLVLLLVTATLASMGVYFYTSNDEKQDFEANYKANAHRIIGSFHDAVERRLGATNSMATAITSYALDTKQTFPFVTVPNFEIRGSDLRVQADAIIVHWLPLVTDETRTAWEEYALTNRAQIDEAFEQDTIRRKRQDDEFGLTNSSGTGSRILQQSQKETILDDGTGYHPRIWSNGATSPRGDEPKGRGPFLPLWQRR